ncbi:FG-GAP repeat domain-containing protein [Methylobacterium sp.]|uniref:FG-GAP repeat domain-containing protein n=1 Tax=Methylobacterium sp. TaxID=409 RepID=UPI003B01045F
MHSRIRCLPAILLTLFGFGPPASGADDDAFEIVQLPTQGRTVAVTMADVDGDGRKDLVQAAIFGVPPDEKRELIVFLQPEAGGAPRGAELPRAAPRQGGDL